jgi:nanoRNase/pAp phosphatase (c-di-AMP/oligoRNAs hydrolase)
MYGRFLKLVKNSRRIIITCHQNADPDAICSMFLLSRLLKKLKRKLYTEVVAPTISRVSKRVLEHINIKLVQSPSIEKSDAIFIVDTNTTQQLGILKERIENSNKPIVFIDHHAPHPFTKKISYMMIYNEKVSSSCELIFHLYNSFNIKISRYEALATLIGIIYETKHFTLASSKTFITIAKLITRGAMVEEAIKILKIPMPQPEKIARLKAAQRMQIWRLKDWIAVTSEVGSYHASAARGLVTLGADVAIVGSEEKGRIKISLRSNKEFFEKSKVHLGKDIAIPVGDFVNGVGGGHALAAGINGSGSIEFGINKCMELLTIKLGLK